MRDEQWLYLPNGSLFSSYSQGIKSILSWRIVNWVSGLSGKSSFVAQKGETVMKDLVTFNLASSATVANGRKRDGVVSGVTIESDSAGGSTIDWRCHGENILETLRDLAIPAGGDFDLEASTPTAYEFKFYSGQLGTDLSATIEFSLGNNNMADPRYFITRSTEKTVACVWGQGEGDLRNYAEFEGTNFHTTNNDIEFFVDGKSVTFGDTDGLESRGELSMITLESKDKFTFKVIQSEGYKYREDYDLGDLVKARNPFTDTLKTMQIKSVTIKLTKDGNEDIEVELEPR